MAGQLLANEVDRQLENFKKRSKELVELLPEDNPNYTSQIADLKKRKIAFIEWKTGFGKKENLKTHWYDVDEGVGRYRFDCGGMVKYMIGKALPKQPLEFLVGPKHSSAIKNRDNGSGHPFEWIDYAEELKKKVPGRFWELVAAPGYNSGRVNGIKRGDILIKRGEKRGHVLIALGEPNSDGHLLIADSTSLAKKHSNDTRKDTKANTGMGKGTIKVVTSRDGTPQLVWSTKPNADIFPLWVVRPLSNPTR